MTARRGLRGILAGVNPFGGVPAPSLAPLPGEDRWNAGADLLLGFGDADGDPATPAPVWLPGAFVELEKRDFFGWGSRWAGFGKRDASVGFRYNLIGPRIPAHEFKETRLLYLSDEYREQILQQREKRRVIDRPAAPHYGGAMERNINWYRTPLDKELLRRLTARSDARGLLQAGSFLLFFAATVYLTFFS